MKHKIKTLGLLALAYGGALLPSSLNAQENNSRATASVAPAPPSKQEHAMSDTVIPVWQDINSRYTPAELFQKIMKLANQGWTTPKEVEETFGIKFKPPLLNQGQVGSVYVIEGDNTKYGSGFVLFHHEEQKSWTLILNGFSAGKSKDECIRYWDALKTILDMGWIEEQIPAEIVEYRYIKNTDVMNSRLHIGNRLQVKADACLSGIQFSNFIRAAIPAK